MKAVSKKSLEKWRQHCLQVQEMSVVNAFEDVSEKEKRIERAKADYGFFVKYYFPHYASVDCARFQIDAANRVANNPKIRYCAEWARNHGKSVHFDVFIGLWLLIKKELHVMLLVGKSQESANILLADIQAELEFNQRYINDFGEQLNLGTWEEGRFITKNGIAFFAIGRGQSPRGLRYKQHRPDYVVLDDIDDDSLSGNESLVNKLVDWCLSALFPCMDLGNGRFVIVGNRISKNSVLAKLSQVPGITHTVVNALDEDGNPSWAEKYSIDEINEVCKTIGTRLAQKEYFNNPISETSVFKEKNIRYKEMNITDYKYLVSYTDASYVVKGDFKATVIAGINTTGEYHVLKAYVEQCTVSRMIQWHYSISNEIGSKIPVYYYMEANFIQSILFNDFIKAGEENGIQIPILPDKRKKPEKLLRIVQGLQPLCEKGLIFFNLIEKNSEGMKRLVEQLLMMEQGSKYADDAPDAMEGCVWILNTKSKVEQPIILGKRSTVSNSFRY